MAMRECEICFRRSHVAYITAKLTQILRWNMKFEFSDPVIVNIVFFYDVNGTSAATFLRNLLPPSSG